MTATNKLMLALLLGAVFHPVLAEEGADEPRIERRVIVHSAADAQAAPHVALLPRLGVRSIRNAPYSAQMVTERQQNLADGNQITERRSTMSYRDNAGRTRQEVLDDKGELKMVTIHDPVAGATWVLRPQERTATKIANRGALAREAGQAAGARIEQMRKDGTLPSVERRKLDDGQEEIIVKRIERADGETRQHIQENVRIQVSKALAENSGALRDMQLRIAPLAGAFGDAKWASKATIKDLGTRDFNGVKAEGKLRSYEIPAGEIGNRNAIVVSDETWFAPDLKVTVYTKHSDPRSGDTVMRLENLKREEPAASLFSVPSDYTVKEPLAQAKEKTGQ